MVQAVLCLHGSLTTWFSKKTRFILVLSFVHLVLNHSSAYTFFCIHGCFSKVSKNSVSRGPPVSAISRPKIEIPMTSFYHVVSFDEKKSEHEESKTPPQRRMSLMHIGQKRFMKSYLKYSL